MRTLRRSLLAWLVLLGACVGGPTSHVGATAFVGVTVLPMTRLGASLPDHTVVVEQDRIVALGPAAEIPVPRGALRIDGFGNYLIPGLADMHVHLEYFDEPDVLKWFLANGVTTVRNMDGREYILDWRSAVEDGSLLGPTIYTAGPILDGSPPVLPDNTIVTDPSEARTAVQQQVEAGYDFVKVYSALAPEVYRAILETARDLNVPVAGHVPRSVDLAGVLSGQQATIEHLFDLGVFIEADDSPFRDAWHWSKLYAAMPVTVDKLSELAMGLADRDIRVVPTLVQANRALASAPALEEWSTAAELRHLPADALAAWEDMIRRTTARMEDEDWALVEQGRRNRLDMVGALHQAGVDLLVGTDTPNPFVTPGFSVAEELENFVEAGLSPAEALMAATREPATFLGASESWGTIQVGRRADLVLLDADPLDDVGRVRQRLGVMTRGRWLTAHQLDSLMADARIQ